MSAARPVLGIFGAGKSGVAIARLALGAGRAVAVASSGPADETEALLRFVAPGAVATTARDLPTEADLLVLAVPLRRFRELPLDALTDRVVIDVMNYWPPIDGVLPEFAEARRPSSTVVRDALPPSARLVKTFNHLGYHQMEDLARPAGSPHRAALAIAGDDPAAVEAVARLVDDLGFDPVAAGPLVDSDALEPGSAVFGQHLDAAAMRLALRLDDDEAA